MKRVVVTGMGALTPIGNSVSEYRDALRSGKRGAGPITRFDPEFIKTKFACEVKDFDPLEYFNRRDVRRMDPYTIYALKAAGEAMEDAGFDLEKLDKNRCGVIFASGIGGFTTIEHDLRERERLGKPRYSPFLIPKMISDIAAGYISIKYGFKGINYATVSACASSSHAIINAIDYIKLGKAKVIIAGGAEASVTEAGIGGFSAMKALSTRNEDPKTASRPFDVDRDGFVLGEGAGALILEEYEHAKARGAHIYAELLGGGMTADAYHITAPHPEGEGAKNVMKFAIEDAGLNPEDVSYVNVHGTSTPLGDIAEVKAIQHVFGQHAYNLNISSTKSMTGHLLGAAGAIETIAGILATVHDFVPPTINHFNLDPALDENLNFTFNQAQEKQVDVVLNNTFGFGGHNASIVIKKWS